MQLTSIVRFGVIPLVFAFELLIGATWTAPARSAGDPPYPYGMHDLDQSISKGKIITAIMLVRYKTLPRSVAMLKEVQEHLTIAGHIADDVY